jgi:RNA polymerase sigma-70 factor (ECF subfamily)
MAHTDEELLVQAIRGDEEALSTLLMRHGPWVRQRLAGKIPAHFQSVLSEDDILQVTYLDALLNIVRFQPQGPGSFPAWLAKIAENNLRNALASLEAAKRPDPRKRADTPRGSDSLASLLAVLSDPGTTPCGRASRVESKAALEEAVKKLPRSHEQVVRLYDLEGRPVSEVASLMERTEGAVYMLRARAHERLRELLGATSSFFTTSS